MLLGSSCETMQPEPVASRASLSTSPSTAPDSSLPRSPTPDETTTTEPATTTTEAPPTTVRRTTTTAASRQVVAPSGREDSAFWDRLSACEQLEGPNYFQFMGGTEDKVGWHPGASYEQQKQMAIWWAAALRAEGTHPGSRYGWPECWWIAGGT